jgi:hypothetical protein
MGVELLNGVEGLPAYSFQSNSEYHQSSRGSQSVGDNVHAQKGNNPDHQLRPQIHTQFLRKLECRDSQDVGLEAATI